MKGRSILIGLWFCLFIGLISCKDDPPFNPLLGNWTYLYETYSACDNITDEGRFDFPCNSTDCYKITFQENGKLNQNSLIGGVTTNTTGTYSFDGSDLVLCSPGCSNPMKFSVVGTTLTITREDDAGCTVATVLEKII